MAYSVFLAPGGIASTGRFMNTTGRFMSSAEDGTGAGSATSGVHVNAPPAGTRPGAGPANGE